MTPPSDNCGCPSGKSSSSRGPMGPRGPVGPDGPNSVTSETESDGTAELSLAKVKLAPIAGGATEAGDIAFDSDSGTLDAALEDGIRAAIGEDGLIRVTNSSGTAIAKGEAIAYSGTINANGRLEVSVWAGSNSPEIRNFLGFAVSDIADGADGFSKWFGKLTAIDADGGSQGEVWAAGDTIYAVPGNPAVLTNTLPATGSYVIAADIINAGSGELGSMFVRPSVVQFNPSILVHESETVIDGIYTLTANENFGADHYGKLVGLMGSCTLTMPDPATIPGKRCAFLCTGATLTFAGFTPTRDGQSVVTLNDLDGIVLLETTPSGYVLSGCNLRGNGVGITDAAAFREAIELGSGNSVAFNSVTMSSATVSSINTGGSPRIGISSSSVTIYVDLDPSSNGARDMGSSSLRWRYIYCANIDVSSSVTINGSLSAADALFSSSVLFLDDVVLESGSYHYASPEWFGITIPASGGTTYVEQPSYADLGAPVQKATMTSSTTFELPSAAGNIRELIFILTKNAGSGTATFNNCVFPVGTAAFTADASDPTLDVIKFLSDGTRWIGMVQAKQCFI